MAARDQRLGRPGWAKGSGVALFSGAVGAALFLFLFPRGALSTLMHEVLHLPGPGAGIALMVGPMALVFMLAAAGLVPRFGMCAVSAIGFALLCIVVSVLLGTSGKEKGMFGSPLFLAAMTTCGLAADILLMAAARARPSVRFLLASASANLVLLVFYWLVVFPQSAGWVSLVDVPILLVLAIGGGLVAGLLGWLFSRRFGGMFPRER